MFKQSKASVLGSNDTTQAYVKMTFYQSYLPAITKSLKEAIEKHGHFAPKNKRKAKGDGTHIEMMLPKEIADAISKVLPAGAVLKVEKA